MTEIFPRFFEVYPNLGKVLDVVSPLPELLFFCLIGLLLASACYSVLEGLDRFSMQRSKEVADICYPKDNVSPGFTALNGKPIKKERDFYGPELL